MADTVIRDVVVRITLEQIQAAIKAPDVTPVKAGVQEVNKAIKDSSQERIKAESETEQAVKASNLRQRQFIKDLGDAARQGAKEYEQLQKMKADADAKAAQAAEAAAQKQRAGTLKVLEVTGQLGEGTFQLARGFAFLSTSTDGDFRQMLATIAKFQGGFDVIKGGATTIKGLMEGTVALKAATGAATVVQAIQTVGMIAFTTATTAATIAVNALKAALGPIGALITVIGLAVAGVAALWSKFSSSEDDAAESAKKANEQLKQQIKLVETLRGISRQTTNERIALLGDDDREGKLRERIKAAPDSFANLKSTEGILRSSIAERSARGEDTSQQESLLLANLKQQVEVSEQLKEDQRQIYDLAIKKADAQERELEKAKQVNEANIKGLETAREKLRVEEGKLQSINAQFGALSKGEQDELRRLSERVKAGETLNRRELERAERLGGSLTRDFVERQRARQGEAAGAADIGAAFGNNINAGVEGARRGISEAEALAAASQEAVTKQEELLAASREARQQEVQVLDQILKDLDEYKKKLAELVRTQERNSALEQ